MTPLQGLGKLLVIAGIGIAAVGVLLLLAGKIPFLGRLPGDIYIKKDNYTVYFPMVTCLVISLVISLLLAIFRR
ncbi:MAG: DUF2905 domain-containing protein [Deltaproteobacteria bacterium]|nr:DUF2905 domain-containing protein [Candidatus Anaeroferrophillacea bacterium]